MAKQTKQVENDGFEKVGGFEAEFFSFKKAGDTFIGNYLKTENVQKKSKFSKGKVEVKRFYFVDENDKKWQIDSLGNLGYLMEKAELEEGTIVKIVYNGKQKGTDKKLYHNFDLFVKK